MEPFIISVLGLVWNFEFSFALKLFYIQAKILDDFGDVEWIDAGFEDEFGFITELMSENHYRNHAHNYDNVLGRIRMI